MEEFGAEASEWLIPSLVRRKQVGGPTSQHTVSHENDTLPPPFVVTRKRPAVLDVDSEVASDSPGTKKRLRFTLGGQPVSIPMLPGPIFETHAGAEAGLVGKRVGGDENGQGADDGDGGAHGQGEPF